MKNILIIIMLILTNAAYSQFNRDPYRDSDEHNFHLRNGKVYFQRVYNHPVSFELLEKKLMSYNTPSSGFQIKSKNDQKMNGIFVNYHMNWNYAELKSRKIPLFLKNPANGTFEVEKNGNSYQVTINNIWFSNVSNPKNPGHFTLEDFVTGKQGVVFTKKKKDLRSLKMIDENFQEIFKLQGSSQDVRF